MNHQHPHKTVAFTKISTLATLIFLLGFSWVFLGDGNVAEAAPPPEAKAELASNANQLESPEVTEQTPKRKVVLRTPEADECDSKARRFGIIESPDMDFDIIIEALSGISGFSINFQIDTDSIATDADFRRVPWDCVLAIAMSQLHLDVEYEPGRRSFTLTNGQSRTVKEAQQRIHDELPEALHSEVFYRE